MATNMKTDIVWTLNPINLKVIPEEASSLMISGETVVMAFHKIQEQLTVIFTNKRIISFDKQGITGARKSILCLPYAKIQCFSIQTPAVAIVAESELVIKYDDGFTVKCEFKGDVDVSKIGRAISECVMK